LIARLEALRAPDAEASRERAVEAVPGRIRSMRAEKAPRRVRPLLIGLGAACLAAAIVALVSLGGGGSEQPGRAYGAELVRFAESTPLLLLEGPGWRVQHVNEYKAREGTEGSMEFVTGKAIPYESIEISGPAKAERESGMFPPAVRQRRVELSWRHESLAKALAFQHETLHPHGKRWVEMPVLGRTAQVDTRAEFYVNQGGPGNREMVAIWSEGGWVLSLRAAVPDQAAFEERLGWLTRVDSQAWLEAMPAAVVKAADFEGTVREMIEGIPLPKTFAISRVPDEGLTTNREEVGSKVAGTISCLWLRQWGAAINSGDTAAAQEAVEAMATSRHWKILTEVESTNGYSPLVWEIADAMKKGYWVWDGHRRKLLPHAEGLGCARFGLPLMAKKIKRQRERGVPPPP
ncbi:MAG TPA: hypothetical protein VHU86_05220, partial [Solirubrobacterales bacterium]|nr:hypothetical protein [Solirubrobacterales bacterium]